MRYAINTLIAIVLVMAFVITAGFAIHLLDNAVDYTHNKIDEATKYENLKKVEDTCRSMIASYESDKFTYDIYKDSEDPNKVEWAEQAHIRANKTAAEYNNYMLKNSFLWKGNIPADIYEQLEPLN